MLKCPSCGESPIFCELGKVRSFRDWATPLEGCEKCGYKYDREPGYFLMAVWAVNYGVCGIFGVALYVTALLLGLELPQMLAMVLTPVAIANVLFVRHAKAYFLAFDHFVDPPYLSKNRI